MASPSVTHTFANDTTIDANKFNTNFNDILAAMTDGTKTFNIAALTLETLTVSLLLDVNGDAEISGDLDVTGEITAGTYGDIIPTSDSAEDIGTDTIRFRSIYADNVYAATPYFTSVPQSSTGYIGEIIDRSVLTPTSFLSSWGVDFCGLQKMTLTTGTWQVYCDVAFIKSGTTTCQSVAAPYTRVSLTGYDITSAAVGGDCLDGVTIKNYDTTFPAGTTAFGAQRAFNTLVYFDGTNLSQNGGVSHATSVLKLKIVNGGVANSTDAYRWIGQFKAKRVY